MSTTQLYMRVPLYFYLWAENVFKVECYLHLFKERGKSRILLVIIGAMVARMNVAVQASIMKAIESYININIYIYIYIYIYI